MDNIRSKKKRIYLCLAHPGGKEQDYIRKAFEDDWIAPLGPNVDGFEEDLKQFLGGEKEVLAVSSGTAAVHLDSSAAAWAPETKSSPKPSPSARR